MPTDGALQPGPFISYSRTDQEFVRRLHDALRHRGRDTWVDWQGILPTEEWMAKIRAAIDAAQAFVFVISPASIASTVCRQEIDHAVAQNKRLIPVIALDIEAAGAPESLSRLNWIFIRPSDDFERKVDELVEAMDTDLDWVRAQSRLLVRAGEWERGQRDPSALLRGRELKDAEQWLLSCGQDSKRQATAQQIEYVVVSRQGENRRRTVALGATGAALVIAIALGIFAWWQRNNAKFESAVALSRQLAAQSEMVRTQRADMLPLSLALAVESLARSPIRSLEADQAVRHAWASMPRVVARLGHEGEAVGVAYSADGTRVATLTAQGAGRVWNAVTGQPIGPGWKGDNHGVAIAFLPGDTNTVMTASAKTLERWNASTGQRSGRPLEAPPGLVTGFAISADGRHVASVGRANEVRVWDLVADGDQPIAAIQMSGHPNDQIETSAAFSRDGRYFAATRRGTLTVFEVGEWGRPLAEVALPAAPILPLAFSSDNRFLAVRLGRAVQLRRVRDWESVLASLDVPDRGGGGVWRVPLAISASGRYVASATGEDSVTVWEVDAGKPAVTVRQEGKLTGLQFSPQFDDVFATAGEDGTARTWMVGSARELARMTHGDAVRAIAFSPTAALLATSAAEAAVIWESTAHPDVVAIENQDGVARAWISPSGRCLWTASGFENDRGGSVLSRCWDGADTTLLRIPVEGRWTSLTSTPDRRFIAGSRGEAAVVWDTVQRKQVAHLEHVPPLDWTEIERQRGPRHDLKLQRLKEEGSVRVIAISDDGRYVITTRADQITRVWDAVDRREVFDLPREPGPAIALSPRGSLAAIAVRPDDAPEDNSRERDTVRVFNPSTGADRGRLRHSRAVEQLFFSNDEQTLVTVEAGNTARTWALDGKGREMATVPHFGFAPPRLSGDGKYLLSRADLEHVRVWDAGTGQPVSPVLPAVAAGDPSAFAFSRDARRFAFGTAQGIVNVAGLPGGRVIAQLSHAGAVSALAFSDDGRYLVTGSEDATARILDIDANREIARVAHSAPVRDVSWSADDGARYLATAGGEAGRASLWWPGDLRDEACRRISVAFSDRVWSRYLGSERPVGCPVVGAPSKR